MRESAGECVCVCVNQQNLRVSTCYQSRHSSTATHFFESIFLKFELASGLEPVRTTQKHTLEHTCNGTHIKTCKYARMQIHPDVSRFLKLRISCGPPGVKTPSSEAPSRIGPCTITHACTPSCVRLWLANSSSLANTRILSGLVGAEST